jgi:excisionase family DNA binding protein
MALILTDANEISSIVKIAVLEAFKDIPQAKITIPPESPFLSLTEASKLLNLAPQTLYGLTSKKQIPFIKKSKKLLFERKVLIDWLKSTY